MTAMDVPEHVAAAAVDCAAGLTVIESFNRLEVNGVECRGFTDSALSSRSRVMVHARMVASHSSAPDYFILLSLEARGPQIHRCGEVPSKVWRGCSIQIKLRVHSCQGCHVPGSCRPKEMPSFAILAAFDAIRDSNRILGESERTDQRCTMLVGI